MSLAVPDVTLQNATPLGAKPELAMPVVVAAPAKINLYLHVLGRRDDGYHLLDSLAVFTDVGDTLEAFPAEDLTLSIEGPFAEGLSSGPDNLVMRAAERLADQWVDKLFAGRARPGASLKLTKRLPVASGIGGGSADAAAALRALSALWSAFLGVPALRGEELDRIALSLGADVPVCLRSTSSFMTGVGEEIDPAPLLPAFWLVLANPGVAVPTASVFKRRRGPFSELGRFTEQPATAEVLAALLRDRTNDLMPPALEVAPVIGEVIAALAATHGCLLSRMSGSGATCFGLFADEAAARSAAEVLGDRQPAWWVSATSVAGARVCA